MGEDQGILPCQSCGCGTDSASCAAACVMRWDEAALGIIGLLVVWSFYSAHHDASFTFNMFDLIMENGKVSRLACAFMATLVVTSWAVIRMAVDGKLSDVIFSAYGAMWVAPIVAKLFSTPQAMTSQTTSTTSTTSAPALTVRVNEQVRENIDK